jgi:hypothetical protein
MAILFISFGGPTQAYHDALNRICNQAKASNMFDKVIGYTEKDLQNDAKFWEKHKNFIESNPKGYGYWIWKSYINYKTIQEANDDDIIVYADAGCELQFNNIDRLKYYIEIVKNKSMDLNEFGILGFNGFFLEQKYTKMDTIISVYRGNYDIYESMQIVATAFIYRKCKNTKNIMSLWYKKSCIYHLIDDSPSQFENDPLFREHRHDQSLFSLIMKDHGCFTLDYEIGLWQNGISRPGPSFIWDARNASGVSLI